MFKRKIYNELIQWKKDNENSSQKKAFLLKGARQTGKSFIVDKFGHEHYENVVLINFMYQKKFYQCFEGDLDVDTIISKMSVLDASLRLVPHKTVIIFDEIQECPKARSSIKPFCLDGRFDIIATGSLLGVMGYGDEVKASIPVGFESHFHMHPMDFEEFLWALGYQNDFINELKEHVYKLLPIDSLIHQQMLELYKWYLFVGGMPAAVRAYINTKDINKVRKEQTDIINSYKNDFGKHLNANGDVIISKTMLARTNLIYNAIPVQLSRIENPLSKSDSTKFKFNDLGKNCRLRDYIEVIQWLTDAGMINVCYNLKTVASPLVGYKIFNNFKIHLNDTGLLMSSLTDEITSAIFLSEIGSYKGYIYENLIADQLSKNNLPLYFYQKQGNSSEVDFIIAVKSGIYGIEVKANHGKSKSLNNLVNNSSHRIKGIKLSKKNIGLVDDIITIPYYLSFIIDSDFKLPQ